MQTVGPTPMLYSVPHDDPVAENSLLQWSKTLGVSHSEDRTPTPEVARTVEPQFCWTCERFLHILKWGFPKLGVPQNCWFIRENPSKMDDLGVPLFQKTTKSALNLSEIMDRQSVSILAMIYSYFAPLQVGWPFTIFRFHDPSLVYIIVDPDPWLPVPTTISNRTNKGAKKYQRNI